MDLKLKGKNILITGGSRGIGREIALAFAQEGANVAICARQQAALDETVNALQQCGVKAVGQSVNVSNKERYQQWVEQSAQQLGGIDCFIANASALGLEPTEEDWYADFEVDLMGLVRGVNAALPYLKKSSTPSILAIASVSAVETGIGKIDLRPYNSIKSAVINYSKCLAREYASIGIRSNVICPGIIDFPGGLWHQIKAQDPSRYEDRAQSIPLGRMGAPRDIAMTACFIASEQASYMTGANLVIDGGLSRKVHF